MLRTQSYLCFNSRQKWPHLGDKNACPVVGKMLQLWQIRLLYKNLKRSNSKVQAIDEEVK